MDMLGMYVDEQAWNALVQAWFVGWYAIWAVYIECMLCMAVMAIRKRRVQVHGQARRVYRAGRKSASGR